MDGLRKCLADEFSSIHVFNLRGDAENIRRAFQTKGRREMYSELVAGNP